MSGDRVGFSCTMQSVESSLTSASALTPRVNRYTMCGSMCTSLPLYRCYPMDLGRPAHGPWPATVLTWAHRLSTWTRDVWLVNQA